jgi:hypothetical protein
LVGKIFPYNYIVSPAAKVFLQSGL